MTRTIAAFGLLVLTLAGGGLLGAAPAAAHVTINVSTTAAGATTVVRLEVPHGCAGSATTELAVRLPAGLSDVAAESTERWAVEQGDDGLTFRTDAPLPDALRDEVVFSVRLPDEVGAQLVLPVVQRCEEGESAWTEVAEDAASREELDLPAPVIVVTAAEGADGAAVAGTTADSGRLMTYGAVGVLAASSLAAGAVLLLRRRRA